jgi:signal transduction histidine kinase
VRSIFKKFESKFDEMNRDVVIFLTLIIVCAVGIVLFLGYYFSAYQNPYMKREIIDLSEGWQYETPRTGLKALDSLRTGPMLSADETMTLYRTLDSRLSEAAILIRANHQSVNTYIDDIPLHTDPALEPGKNPGMALHFLTLPEDYTGKTLKIELTSPYALYSGRTSPILLGTIPSLEAYALSASMRSVVLMAVCLALGLFIIAFAFVKAVGGDMSASQLTLGVFAVIWALYFVCTEYIVFQFFTPFQMSAFSLGLYYSFAVPLTLFFYFSFKHYKKLMLPAVILQGAFTATALALQLTGLVDLPRLLNINNIFLTGLIYTVVLAIMEALKKNRIMILAAPFLVIAYGSMLFNFSVFYTRRGVVPYSYRDTYLLLALSVLIYSIWLFFREAYRHKQENEMLSIEKRSSERIKMHLKEAEGLKHEIKNHISAIQSYLDLGKAEEAREYITQIMGQSAAVMEAAFSEHFILNAIAGNLYQRAGELGVKVDLKLQAVPLHIADHDLYSLMSNITSNAVEACAAITAGGERFIRLTVTKEEPYFYISCENSSAGEITRSDGKIKTSKTDAGHGYGLRTVERIVEAYGGLLDIRYDENIFAIEAALIDRQ